MWVCEYGTLAAGRVGNECGHVNMGYCVINRVRKAHGNVEYGILAGGSVGNACGHVNMGYCVLKGLHDAYGNVNMGHAYISICIRLACASRGCWESGNCVWKSEYGILSTWGSS